MRTTRVAIIACVFGLVLGCVGLGAVSERAVARATRGEVTVTLIDGDCRLKRQITNLPYRATWTEKGKTDEGCYAVFGTGLVVMYFEDRTATAASILQFESLR